jgi:hypothetical protein
MDQLAANRALRSSFVNISLNVSLPKIFPDQMNSYKLHKNTIYSIQLTVSQSVSNSFRWLISCAGMKAGWQFVMAAEQTHTHTQLEI